MEIQNKVYSAIIGELEALEGDGRYKGNGHHLAQRLTMKIAIALLSKQQKSIYDLMGNLPSKSKEIANRIGMSSKHVSAQLKQMEETSGTVGYTKVGRYKFWHRLK